MPENQVRPFVSWPNVTPLLKAMRTSVFGPRNLRPKAQQFIGANHSEQLGRLLPKGFLALCSRGHPNRLQFPGAVEGQLYCTTSHWFLSQDLKPKTAGEKLEPGKKRAQKSDNTWAWQSGYPQKNMVWVNFLSIKTQPFQQHRETCKRQPWDGGTLPEFSMALKSESHRHVCYERQTNVPGPPNFCIGQLLPVGWTWNILVPEICASKF